MTPLRIQPYSYEHTLFENKSNNVYSLVNPEDSDRVIVDPAYRLEKLKLIEQKSQVYDFSLKILDESQRAQTPAVKRPISVNDYENLHEAEQSVERLERIFKRVTRFHSRQFLDVANHDRREKMKERSDKRVRDSYTVYIGQTTEEELKYRDYFETDLENEADNILNMRLN